MTYNDVGKLSRWERGSLGVLTILIAIAVISVMAIKRINIGLAMLAGSAVLVVLTPLSLDSAGAAVQKAFSDPETWILMGSVLLIGILGYVLKNSGAMAAMVDSLMQLLGDARWIIAMVASLIGALTVPGGSMFTAPMVDNLGDNLGMGPEYKTGVNIVFRHVWYVFLPIIPSMLTAASLAGSTAKELAVYNLPALLAGLVAAWFLLLHSLPRSGGVRWDPAIFLKFLINMAPLFLVIIIYVLGVPFLISLSLGVVLALFNLPGPGAESWLKRTLVTGFSRGKKMLLPGIRLQLPLAVAGVMVFKELLAAGGLVTVFAQDLVGKGFPLWLLMVTLPFFIGLATGFHEAAIGIAIPIFLPLLSSNMILAGVSLTYIAATIGYTLSPLHLCVILTREYFGAKFLGTYRYIAPVALIMLLVALGAALLRGV